ncbi:MAG: hypothetical protein H0W44_05570 [Gammaproteobacteria bacterium]|nr:hypothetical protein [Gammaproteobacteria bacterium]
MTIGVDYVIRETLLSSLDMTGEVLQNLGLTFSQASDAVEYFREFDQKLLDKQLAIHDDQTKLIASTKEAAAELRGLFEADTKA